RFTDDRNRISWPILTGCRKFMWSTEAVTTGQRACRMAANPPARSTRCMTLPPSTFPKLLASLGSARSEYSETDSRTNLGVMCTSHISTTAIRIARCCGRHVDPSDCADLHLGNMPEVDPPRDALQFETAEFALPELPRCVLCRAEIGDTYYHLDGSVICKVCAGHRQAMQEPLGGRLFGKSVLYGLGAALA